VQSGFDGKNLRREEEESQKKGDRLDGDVPKEIQ
jgi:hypothetical protein